MAAICYVMLSRICALWQLYILNDFDESKMYPHQGALQELKRLENISMNRNLTAWQEEKENTLKISSLNCRSLMKHHEDIISDDLLLKSDMICLQETWLEDDTLLDELQIPDYKLHLNSNGRGKGIAIYYKKEIFTHEADIKEDNLQLSKFNSPELDIVVLYRSQNGNHTDLKQHLRTLTEQSRERSQLVIGDFNFCFLDGPSNPTRKYLQESNFSQIIIEPTHIEGNLLDQAHIRDIRRVHEFTVELQSKYYTDHKAVAIIAKKIN